MAAPTESALAAHAAYVLRGNDTGTLTTAAPKLYPHQWSWDAAFITMGLSTLSVPRAIAELDWLLAAQWSTGMLPHIVFAPDTDYFPGPEVWVSQRSEHAPKSVRTSGICQPPVHAIAVQQVLAAGRRAGGAARKEAEEFVARTFDQWLAWHRWLDRVRDPHDRGLLEIHHGWESGMDNSPRWDAAYAAVLPREETELRRHDLAHVEDAAQRPTDAEYQRYLWLVRQMREVGYDDERVRDVVDFRMVDVFMSAIMAIAGDVLAELGDELGRSAEAAELRETAGRFRRGVLSTVSPETGLARDLNVLTGAWVQTETIAGFAPLLSGGDDALVERQLALLASERWCGHPELKFAVPPSTSPCSADFRPRSYWRGPQWPVVNWLLTWALNRQGATELAESIRGESLRQLADLAFGEYYEPFTGEALGSRHQSWTAAVTLGWLSDEPAPETHR
ncbi:glucosylglycerate hydrolase [Streptomyces sp. NPDC004069]